ncbi:hypothetical protein [Spiroplasma endosymbiont of Virgichneumon dumeticola]|uniref:hypothetical protein n=1 Tax=Spiroplasma endosymbiont of Virgichneumon dumeticola TaxID=3139323 RepID=UPI0035C8C759
MNYQELYVVCQIEDFNLKLMVNNYVNNQIQVLYKARIENEQFAENGVIINPIATGNSLRKMLDKINKTLNINVQRIVLSLPSNNLKIYQSQAMMDFKDDNHIITNADCSKVIDMAKNIIIDSTEVVCLTKPYSFKVNNERSSEQLPIGLKGQVLNVDALVYSLPKTLYSSQLEVFKNAQVDLLTVTLDQFALACNINNNNNIVLIDWNLNSTKISVFNNSVLYATTNIKIGWNQIIQALMKQMHCGYDKAEKYLQKIININSNYLCDIVVDKHLNEHKQEICLTKSDLQTTVQNQINEIITCIEYFLDEVSNNNSREMEVICTGITVGLAGFANYFKNHSKLATIKYMLNQNLGAYSYNWTSLIGVTHYQHLVNVFNNNIISSINTLPILPKANHHRLPQNNETKKYNSPNFSSYQYNGNSK